MNLLFYSFRRKLELFPCFSLVDISKHFIDFDSNRLVEWQARGYIKKIRNGFYIWDDFNEEITNWWGVSHKCYSPSYVSLQTALSVYGFIPEGVFSITAISTSKTYSFQSHSLHFKYHHIKSSLFWGYIVMNAPNGLPYCIATPEKAMLDFLYFNEALVAPEDFEAMRFNKYVMKEQLDQKKFKQYAELFRGKRFNFRSLQFLNWLYA